MTGTLARKIRADLLTNKLRSALAIVSLAVGTTAVGAMYLASTAVDASFETSFAATEPPSAVLVTQPFQPELLDDVTSHPQVAQAEARRLQQVQVATTGGDRTAVELVAMPDFERNQLARIRPTEGTWPPAPGSIVIERASVAELGVALGDVVTVDVPGRASFDLTVDGTAVDVSEVAPMLGGSVRGYVTMQTMVELTGSDHLDALYLLAADGPLTTPGATAMTAAVRDDVLEPSGTAIVLNTVDEPGEHRAATSVSFITLAMQLLSLLALAIAVALVINTMAALLAQQRRQIGVMKAIGATTRQLTRHYLTYVVALSMAAVAVSVPVSLLLGRAVTGFVAGLANVDPVPMGLPIAAITLQVALATLLPIGAVVFTIRRAARTTVREAITDRGIVAAPRAAGPTALSRQTMLALRNALRNRTRLALTVLTVTACGAVIVGVSSTGSALGELSDEVAGYTAYDLELALTEPVSVAEAAATLGTDRDVEAVEGWQRRQGLRIRPDATGGANIDLTGVPTDSRAIAPTLLEGRWLLPGDDRAIVINTHLAEAEADLVVGGDVVLEIEGTREAWRIVGISSTTLVGPVAYVPADGLAELTGDPDHADVLAVRLTDGAVQADAADRLGSLALDAGLPVAQVQTNEEIRSATDSLFDIVVVLLLLVGAILAVVAVVGVAGTMTLGVFEQTREIGVLRTLGATTWAVRRLLLVQGLGIGAIGAALGALLSVPVTLLLGAAISSNLVDAAFPFSFSWLALGVWLFVALAIGAIGATQPARAAARLTIRETLAYE